MARHLFSAIYQTLTHMCRNMGQGPVQIYSHQLDLGIQLMSKFTEEILFRPVLNTI